jgi:AcrR family transcriptional regulator
MRWAKVEHRSGGVTAQAVSPHAVHLSNGEILRPDSAHLEKKARSRHTAWEARGVTRGDWLVGDDRRAFATERIYEIATELIAHGGFAAFDIDALAARAHCSRATIYRHVGGKAELRDGVLIRVAARIVDTVRRTVEGMSGPDRVVTAIAVALDEIRSDPLGQLMIGRSTLPQQAEVPASLAMAGLATELTGIAADDPQAAQWIVHVVLSMVYLPVGNSQVERELLQRFVAPAFERPSSRISV